MPILTEEENQALKRKTREHVHKILTHLKRIKNSKKSDRYGDKTNKYIGLYDGMDSEDEKFIYDMAEKRAMKDIKR